MQILGQAGVELVSVDGGFAAGAQDDFRKAGERAGNEFERGAAARLDARTSPFRHAADGAGDGFAAAGRSAGNRFADGVEGEARRRGPGFSSVFGGIARGAALAFAGAFAVVQIGGFLGGLVSDAQESARVANITANAIRATGGAANVTADQVGTLAGSISNLTGVDDELVQSGANLVLTFKNVKNEAGRGNDVFNQATKAAVDLSAAGFGSVESASIQLGKALNDPVKGIAALGRSGVTFTAQQKKTISGLVKNNDLLGAQKIILGEVNAQVGGAAQAAANPVARLNVIWGNLRETLGGALLPVVAKVADALSDFIGGLSGAAGADGPVARLGGLLSTLGTGVSALFAAFANGDVTSDGFVGVLERIGAGARGLFDLFVNGNFSTALRSAFGVEEDAPIVGLLFTVREAIGSTYSFITTQLVPGIQSFVGALVAALGPGIAGVFSAVSGYIAVLVPRLLQVVAVVRDNWPAIQATIQQVMAAVISIIQASLSIIASVFRIATKVITTLWDSGFGKVILRVVQIVLPAVLGVIRGVLNIIVGVFQAVAAILKGDWSGLWEAIKKIAGGAGTALLAIIKGALKLVAAAFTALLPALITVFSKIQDKMGELGMDLVQGIAQGITDHAFEIGDALSGGLLSAVSKAKDLLKINSPSKVAADELGSPLPEGVAFGIRRDGSLISEAMSDVLNLNAVEIPEADLRDLTRQQGTPAGARAGGGRQTNVYLATRVTAPEVMPYIRAQADIDAALYAGTVS